MAKKNNIQDEWEAEQARKGRFDKFFSVGPIDELDTKIAKPYYRYRISGIECVPSGDVIAIAGKPGVGKSTALAILIGVLVGNKTFGGISCVTPCHRVLWIDTEKGYFSCINRIKTLKKVAGFDESKQIKECGVDFFPMKDVLSEDRLFFVEELSKKAEYDVIVIDGIFDLTDEPDKNYSPVVNLLKRLTSNNTSVFALLHTNKQAEDDNMRYALGTELQRICTTRFTIRYDEKKECHNIIHAKSNDTGLAPIVSFKFNEQGDITPFIPETGTYAKIDSSKKDFESIFAGGVVFGYSELVEKVKDIAKIKERGAKERIKKGVQRSYLVVDDEGNYYLNNDQ